MPEYENRAVGARLVHSIPRSYLSENRMQSFSLGILDLTGPVAYSRQKYLNYLKQ